MVPGPAIKKPTPAEVWFLRLSGSCLPAVLREEIEAHYPIYRQPPPLDDERPNDTSWTVFKRWIDARRAAGELPEQAPR